MIPALIAPLLANGLNLLVDVVTSKGKEWITDKTGIDITKPLSNDDLLKLKQLEMDHEEELLKLTIDSNIDLEKAYLADTNSARSMQSVALQQDDLFAKRFVLYFAVFWSVLTAMFIGGITFIEIPKDNIRFADTILGFLLGTIIAQIVNFFYGSSRSSQSKDNLIKEMARSPK